MTLIHSIAFGMFLLILTYLGVKNAGGVTSIFNAGGTQINNISKTLQGR
jgi:hypothetical protein